MRSARIATSFILLAIVTVVLSAGSHAARRPEPVKPAGPSDPELVTAYHVPELSNKVSRPGDQGSGIKEDIPQKYAARYAQWKREFLATEAGKDQWASYQSNPNFLLKIEISRSNAEGATTGNYEWNSSGKLISATISLGNRLDAGYPNPIYFPVMNSLVPTESSYKISGATLAATKLAHEFGHVNRTTKIDPALYRLQSQLIPEYNRIFLSNGLKANDPRLLELARQIGGTPVEIWEDREYWGEANAMVFLRDRFTDESLRCPLFARIRQTVDLYARNYEGRFLEIAQATPSRKICGWQ